MSKIFDLFPKVKYSLNTEANVTNNYDFPLDILVRIGFYSNVLDNIFVYYDYDVEDGETPEILAEKYYGDPESYWVILLANKRLDPIYDWPFSTSNFQKYIDAKYGSTAIAQSRVERYEKVIKTVDVSSNNFENIIYYETTKSEYDTLPDADLNPIQKILPNGKSVFLYTYRNIVYSFDHEFELNERRRKIKLIKKEYYNTVVTEFEDILSAARGENNLFKGMRSL